MRPLLFVMFLLTAPAGFAGADHGCKADRKLSDTITDVHIAKATRLAALVQLGHKKNICFGIEAPDPAMLSDLVHVNSSHLTVEAAIRQILPHGSFELSEQHGVILIRRADFGTWLDHSVPAFVVDRTTVQWASMNLFVTVARMADPSIGGFAGDYNPGNADDIVGPVNEQNKRLWELLTLIVSSSRGGAWISSRCAVTDESVTREPCWTILEYTLPLEATVEQAVGFAKKVK